MTFLTIRLFTPRHLCYFNEWYVNVTLCSIVGISGAARFSRTTRNARDHALFSDLASSRFLAQQRLQEIAVSHLRPGRLLGCAAVCAPWSHGACAIWGSNCSYTANGCCIDSTCSRWVTTLAGRTSANATTVGDSLCGRAPAISARHGASRGCRWANIQPKNALNRHFSAFSDHHQHSSDGFGT